MTSSALRALPRHLGGLALLLSAGLAQAQYSWIDARGTRHFSDRPPPPDTPAHRILKTPGRAVAAPRAAPAAQPAAPAQAAAPKSPPTLAEREAGYRERMKQREEEEKKDAELARRQRELAERCQGALQVRAQVESGIRITNVDARGERSVATDEERAAQLARANRILAECR